jgi:hypothetical protein
MSGSERADIALHLPENSTRPDTRTGQINRTRPDTCERHARASSARATDCISAIAIAVISQH